LSDFLVKNLRGRIDGGADAKGKGVKFGRKSKLTLHQQREAIRRRDRDGEPVREIARTYNASHSPISRLG
jgi:DNA invertase Pin-like site-specific DNA recombinase